MKKRFTEEQIIKLLNQVSAGIKAADVCREHGIAPSTFYAWKEKYGGMQASEVKKLRDLESENGKLKKLVAEQALDIIALKDVVSRKW